MSGSDSGTGTLPVRKLGSQTNGTELIVTALGLGGMSLTDSYGIADPAEAEATVIRALDLGITFFDTADAYGSGENERLLGRLLESRRDSIVLASKFGLGPGRAEGRQVDGSPEYLRRTIEASLARLGGDHIDLYYLHRVDPDTPIEETVGAMAELVTAGKIRGIGLSEPSAATIRRAHAVHPITAVQSEYSLFHRGVEAEVLPVLRELGIGFVPYSPLGRGILTGTVTANDFDPGDTRLQHARFQGDAFKANLGLVDRLRAVAARRSVAPAQLALAWVMAQGPDIVPIPGTKRPRYLEENVAAAYLTLDATELAAITEAVPADEVVGVRHPQPHLLDG